IPTAQIVSSSPLTVGPYTVTPVPTVHSHRAKSVGFLVHRGEENVFYSSHFGTWFFKDVERSRQKIESFSDRVEAIPAHDGTVVDVKAEAERLIASLCRRPVNRSFMKTPVLDAIGEANLNRPAQIQAALAANNHIKYYFSMLQMAVA